MAYTPEDDSFIYGGLSSLAGADFSKVDPYSLTQEQIAALSPGHPLRLKLARDRRLLSDSDALIGAVPPAGAAPMPQADFDAMMAAAMPETVAAEKPLPAQKAAPGATPSTKRSALTGAQKTGLATAGLGALAGIGQYYAAVKPATQTAQDVLNQQRLTELRAKEAELKGQVAGKMSAADRQELELLESAQMNPVRALATQQMQRGEAERASMGATRAARQALESERIGRQQVTQAAQQVGLQKAQRFLQQRAEKKAELARTQREIDERTAYESGVERARLAFIGDTIAGVAGLAGKALGGYIPEESTPASKE